MDLSYLDRMHLFLILQAFFHSARTFEKCNSCLEIIFLNLITGAYFFFGQFFQQVIKVMNLILTREWNVWHQIFPHSGGILWKIWPTEFQMVWLYRQECELRQKRVFKKESTHQITNTPNYFWMAISSQMTG